MSAVSTPDGQLDWIALGRIQLSCRHRNRLLNWILRRRRRWSRVISNLISEYCFIFQSQFHIIHFRLSAGDRTGVVFGVWLHRVRAVRGRLQRGTGAEIGRPAVWDSWRRTGNLHWTCEQPRHLRHRKFSKNSKWFRRLDGRLTTAYRRDRIHPAVDASKSSRIFPKFSR